MSNEPLVSVIPLEKLAAREVEKPPSHNPFSVFFFAIGSFEKLPHGFLSLVLLFQPVLQSFRVVDAIDHPLVFDLEILGKVQ